LTIVDLPYCRQMEAYPQVQRCLMAYVRLTTYQRGRPFGYPGSPTILWVTSQFGVGQPGGLQYCRPRATARVASRKRRIYVTADQAVGGAGGGDCQEYDRQDNYR